MILFPQVCYSFQQNGAPEQGAVLLATGPGGELTIYAFHPAMDVMLAPILNEFPAEAGDSTFMLDDSRTVPQLCDFGTYHTIRVHFLTPDGQPLGKPIDVPLNRRHLLKLADAGHSQGAVSCILLADPCMLAGEPGRALKVRLEGAAFTQFANGEATPVN